MIESLVLACAMWFEFCLRSEPAVPAPHTPFDLVYEGHWPDTTVPTRLVSADVDGRDIRLVLSTDARQGQYFQAQVTPFAVRISADDFARGGLPPGTYRVLVEVDRDGPFDYRYESTFGLIDVGGTSIAPRSGVWRALEPGTSPEDQGSTRQDSGIRILVDPRPGHVRLVALGAREGFDRHADISIAYAWPTWAEGLLSRQPRHVEGVLHSAIARRYFDGRSIDRRQTAPDRIDVAIEWLDPRNGVLYLASRERGRPVTPLPLVFDDGLRAPGELARRWLITRVHGDRAGTATIVALEEADHTSSLWSYRDAMSGAVMRCVPVRGETSACLLLEPRGNARATLACASHGCDGHDSRGARVTLARWD